MLVPGEDTVRDLTKGHSPQASHILDLFHVTMRLSVLNLTAKGVAVQHKGEAISSTVAKSSVNQKVSKRFVKKQQMRWTRCGAHLLLQVQTQVLDDTLKATFQRWYPCMETSEFPQESALAGS